MCPLKFYLFKIITKYVHREYNSLVSTFHSVNIIMLSASQVVEDITAPFTFIVY